MTPKIMISYSSADRGFATELHSFLVSESLDVLYDETFVDAGERLTTVIDEMVRQAQKLVVVLSENSLASAWVDYEISMFLTRSKLDTSLVVIPILLQPCELPASLSEFHYLDFTSPVSHSEAKRALLARLKTSQTSSIRGAASRIPLSRPSTYQRAELETLVAKAVDRGMSKMTEDLSSMVNLFQKNQHLMTPDAISRKERNANTDVWVVTRDLYNDVYDPNFQKSVRANLERGIEYRYFLEDGINQEKMKKKYMQIYEEYEDGWKFISLESGVFMPFDEVVIYDARSVGHVWGYAQMKYVVEGRQGDDLFLRIPDRNVVDFARSLQSILERKEST